jgi:uncharacterized protein YbaP (TraB family)
MMLQKRATTRRFLLLALAIACAIGAPVAAQNARSTTTTKSFLWRVESATGALYLAGSVHALSPDIYPLNPVFEKAFNASDTLVEEINLGEMNSLTSAPLTILSKGMFQDGRTFDQVVSKETAALVAERVKDTIPFEMLRPMKPWMVDLMLTAIELQKEGLDANLGLDKHFFDEAQTSNKRVVGLETAESQIDRLDQLPAAVQEQMLRSSLEDLDSERKNLKAIVSAWRRGDAAGLQQLLLAGFANYPAAYASLLVERNRNWMPQLELCLTGRNSCFVVVGAAHLVGPDGLLTMLQKKGYRVTQQ